MVDFTSGHSFEQELQLIKQRGLYRSPVSLDSPQGAVITIADQRLLNFSSNDYLGLANHPQLREAMRQAVEQYGVGSGASPLVCGHNAAHRLLQDRVSALTGRDRTVLFSSGFMANLAVLATFASGRSGAVIQDRLNHASLLDGARLAGARLRRYRHLDMGALERRLMQPPDDKLVVTEAVFSMDGDRAPLPEIAGLCAAHSALLVVDDAHGLGVFGNKGEGSLSLYGLSQREVPLLVLTFGKALGVAGACVTGRSDLIDMLIQKARPYIYSTALPPAVAATVAASLELVQGAGEQRAHLAMLIRQFQEGCRDAGLPVKQSDTPVQPYMIGENAAAMQMSEAMQQQGYLVPAIRPPTVPTGQARLRITLSAAHTREHVQSLLDALVAARAGA